LTNDWLATPKDVFRKSATGIRLKQLVPYSKKLFTIRQQ
jgi:hypothetical protein